MPDASTFVLYFIVATLALLLVPGPAVLCIARSVEGGRPAGLVSVLGVEVGTLVHVFFAATGLSAIVVSSTTAFSVVK